MNDKSEILLKVTATHFLACAVVNMHTSLRRAAQFEHSKTKQEREDCAQLAAYHQLLALHFDEGARMCGIEEDHMHAFMRMFFAQ